MTIQEMHIAVNLGVQKIASFQVDNLLPQEIDHELNTALMKFIKQRYNPMGNKYREGFEQSQKRIDDLRSLVVKSQVTGHYYGQSVENDKFFIERFRLPQDYLFLVNLATQMKFNCAGEITYIEDNFTKAYITVSLNPPQPGWVLKLIRTNYQPTVIISSETGLTHDQLYDQSQYSLGIVPADSIDLTAVTDYEVSPTVDSNTLLLSVPTDPNYVTSLFVFGYRAVWANPLDIDETQDVEYPASNLVTNGQTRRLAPDYPDKKVPCKYVQHDDLLALLYDPFNTTKHEYPKYTIQENFVDIYSDNKFIPILAELTYIRYPKQLDMINGVGCELPEYTHQEIVEMAVKSILEALESPRYQSQSMENMESE
jgi:hypothetical protein